jgi:lipoprotein-anchoring transpeptidase ErfK/SrfK
VTVYETSTGFEVKTVLANPLPSGAPLTFLVDGQTTNRYKVLLPIRPNGSTGWISPESTKKFEHNYRIVIELSAFRLTVYKGKDIALTEKIGVGTDELPTPNGRYYIKELLKAPNPKGIYGPYAYGLSGFSQQLTNWNGGTGVIGIHGTDKPELLGQNVSHGCIRMTNAAITTLASFLPLGTPVIVQP